MKKNTSESGAVMVEAVIIFPMVLLTVAAMLYLGLFKLQESAMLYQVQRVAAAGGLMASSPGYAKLARNGYALDAKDIDWSGPPDQEGIEAYYKAYHESLANLYRELTGTPWIHDGDIRSYGEKVLDTVSVLAAGRLFQTEVELHRSFFGTSVCAEVKYEVRTPGILRFFGMQDTIAWKQGSYSRAVNPAGFIRNTDLAVDVVVLACEKLGISDQLEKITEALTKVRDVLF